MKLNRFLLIGIMLLTTCLIQAQEVKTETPEMIAMQVGESLKKHDWAAFSKIMHRQELVKFKQLFRPMFQAKGAEKARKQFFGVDTQADYDKLSEEAVFESFMKGMVTELPLMSSLLSGSEMVILGHVNEGEDTSHVVYRMKVTFRDVPISKIEVMSFKKEAGAWRALMTTDIESVAKAIAGKVIEKQY